MDDKNRLLIPADVRRKLNPTDGQTEFVIKLGINGVPWIYSSSRWEQIASEGDIGMDPTVEQLNHLHFHYATTHQLEWDKQGRAVVPDPLLKMTKTGKDVTLVGSRDHLELWNRAAWAERTEALLAMYASRGKTSQA